jgi:hypothetical protein
MGQTARPARLSAFLRCRATGTGRFRLRPNGWNPQEFAAETPLRIAGASVTIDLCRANGRTATGRNHCILKS